MVRPYDAQPHIDKDASPNHMRTLEEEEEEEIAAPISTRATR